MPGAHEKTLFWLDAKIGFIYSLERVVRADLCAQNFREAISQTHPVRGTSAPAVRLFFVSPRSAKGGGVYA